MPVNKSHFKAKNSRGEPLITVEELAELTGLSVFHIRERTRPNGRGKFIPSIKLGIRLWFDKTEALAAIYGVSTTHPIVADDLTAGLI